MKKNILSLAMGCMLLALGATAQKNTIKLSGIVNNLVDKKVFWLNGSHTGIHQEVQPNELSIDSSNRFDISIDAPSKSYEWIVLGNQRQRLDFMAKGGSKLTLKINKSLNDTTLGFTGKGSEVPNFFIQLNRDKGGVMSLLRQFQQLSDRSMAEVIPALDSFVAAEKNYLKQHQAGLPEDFVAFWTKFLDYGRLNTMLNYPVIHEMIRLQTNNIREVPAELYAVSAQVPNLFNDDYLSLSLYQSYAESFFPVSLSSKGFVNMPPTSKQPELAYQQTDSVIQLLYQLKEAPNTAALVAGRMLLESAKLLPEEVMAPRLAAYQERFKKTDYPDELLAAVEKATRFNAGKMAPDFSFSTLEGETKNLADYKGKVVYLDFWASWCGPCKREMPHAKTLKEYYKDKDVVFLYVSIDEKEDAWKKGIEAMDISGVHTRTPGWSGDLAKLYEINSVPAYFLIDQEGKLVYKQTPRPSQSEQLKQKIDQLLKQ